MSPDVQGLEPCSSNYLEQKIEPQDEEEEDLFLTKEEMEQFRHIVKGKLLLFEGDQADQDYCCLVIAYLSLKLDP